MARLTNEQLQEVMEKYGVDEIYSWSKVDKAITSLYEYFLKYVLHVKEDRTNCIYAPMGGSAHSIIEDFYGGKIKYEEMIEHFEDAWLTMIDIADLKFDRNDEAKNKIISEKYRLNLEHFFKNHVPIKYKVALEKFMVAKIGDYLLQGYIDASFKDDDGCYTVVDWKTSTKYSGKTAEEKCGQLIVYVISFLQAGIPLEKIKACWNFLKYATIQYEQANGAVKTRDVERYKIGESLQTNAKMWLKKFGYEDRADDYLKLLLDTNDIKCLPEEVQEKYVVSDCYVYVPITEKLINKWIDTIVTAIKDVKLREADYEETHNELCFWDSEENVKAQSYYFSTLCGYSGNLHKPYGEYLKKFEAAQNGQDMFGGIGSDVETSTISSNVIKKDEVDLSWLDNL